MFAERLRPTKTKFKHDRMATVGASEIGACARQTWFRKNGIAEERETGWGYGERGIHMEKWIYARLGRKIVDRQLRVANGHLSCHIDGRQGDTLVDFKTFDPYKKNVVEPKHIMQVQVQLGLYGPAAARGVLLYVNASDYQDAREHVVEPDPDAYAAAHERATWIMTTTEPPPREGVMAGGNECRLCPFQTACLGAPMPTGLGKLAEAETAGIAEARLVVKAAEAEVERNERRIALAKQAIREILRSADARRAPGLARISRSSRTTVDHEAMQRDGIDVDKYRKSGRETESVTVE